MPSAAPSINGAQGRRALPEYRLLSCRYLRLHGGSPTASAEGSRAQSPPAGYALSSVQFAGAEYPAGSPPTLRQSLDRAALNRGTAAAPRASPALYYSPALRAD